MDSEASSGESQDSPVLCRRATECRGVGVLQCAEPTSTGLAVSDVLAEAPDENSYDSDDCCFAWGCCFACSLLLCVQCRAQVHWWCFVSCHRLDHCLHFTIMCLPRVLSHLQ